MGPEWLHLRSWNQFISYFHMNTIKSLLACCCFLSYKPMLNILVTENFFEKTEEIHIKPDVTQQYCSFVDSDSWNRNKTATKILQMLQMWHLFFTFPRGIITLYSAARKELLSPTPQLLVKDKLVPIRCTWLEAGVHGDPLSRRCLGCAFCFVACTAATPSPENPVHRIKMTIVWYVLRCFTRLPILTCLTDVWKTGFPPLHFIWYFQLVLKQQLGT